MLIEILLIVAGIILQVFIPGFPKETLLLQSGIAFGIFIGTAVNWVGMILAAQIGYEVVRRSIETGGRYSNIIKKYENWDMLDKLENNGNRSLFLIRLIPYAPNDVLSLLSGALKLPRKGFILVSITTSFPFALVFAYLGSIGSKYITVNLIYTINAVLFVVGVIALLVNRSRIMNEPRVDYIENQ